MTGNQATARAFTLTEMLVVLVIIGLIAAIVGPRLFSRLDDAKQRTARLQISNLKASVDLFRIDMGRLPTEEEGLDILINAPSENSADWLGPYLARDQIPHDPWGRAYVYSIDARTGGYAITSFGSDGQRGGAGSARDIVSQEGRSRDAAPAVETEAPEGGAEEPFATNGSPATNTP